MKKVGKSLKKGLKYLVISLVLLLFLGAYLFLKPDEAIAKTSVGLEEIENYWVESDNYHVYRFYIDLASPNEVNHLTVNVNLTNLDLIEFNVLNPWTQISFNDNDASFDFDIYVDEDYDGKVYFAEFKVLRIEQSECNVSYSVNFSKENINNFKITKDATDLNGNSINKVKVGDYFYFDIEAKGVDNFVETSEVTLTDTIPSEFEIISSDATSTDGQTLTWELGSFAKGNETKSKKVLVKALEKGSITNEAILSVNSTSITANKKIDVLYSDIEITKKASQSSINFGDTFNYTISVKNTGNTVSDDVVVTDTIDSNLTLVSVSEDYELSDKTLKINVGTLKAGATHTITLSVKANNYIYENEINNIVYAQEGNKDTKQASVKATVLKPNIDVTKEVDKTEVVKGDELTYTIKVNNNGEGKAINVQLVDIINENLELVSITGAEVIGNAIYKKYDSFDANNEDIITFKVRVLDTMSTGTHTNYVSGMVDNKDSFGDDVSVEVIEPVLSVNKVTNQESIKRGNSFKYTIEVKNIGVGTAKNVVVSDTINNNLEVLQVSEGNLNGNELTVNYDTLEENETKTIEVFVKVKSDASIGTITNTVDVTSKNADKVSDSVNVEIIDSNIVINKTVSGSKIKMINEGYKYTITITNNGNSNSNKVTFRDSLPDGFIYTSSNATYNNENIDITNKDNTLEFSVDSISINSSIIIEIYGKVDSSLKDGSVISNTAYATEEGKEQVSSKVDIEIVEPNISITKTSNKDIIKRGNTFKYTIKLVNESKLSISNITVSDIIDSNLEVLSINNTTYTSNNINLNIDKLDSKEEYLIEIEVKAKKDASLGKIDNTAYVKVDDYENSSTTSNEIVDSNIVIKKEIHNTLNNDEFTSKESDYIKSPLEEFTYYIMVTNIGDIKSNKVVIKDIIPSNLEVIDVTSRYKNNLINYTLNNNVLLVEVEGIEVDAFVNIMVKVKIKSDIEEGKLTNVAYATEEGKNEVSSSVDINIVKPNLSMTKTSSVREIKRGETFNYTIKIKNDGNGDAYGVSLVDAINTNLEVLNVSNATLNGQVISSNYDVIKAGEEKIVEIRVKVKSDATLGNIKNEALLSYDKYELKDDVTINVLDSNIEVEKTSSKSFIKPNEEFNYLIKVSNTGDADSNKINIYDEIDSNIEVLKAYLIKDTVEEISIANNILNLNIDTIASNSTIYIKLDVKVKNNVENGLDINNKVIVKEENKDNKEDEVNIKVIDSNIYIEKRVEKDKYQVGDIVKYTITVINSGDASQDNIILEDTFDSSLTFIESSISSELYTIDNNTFKTNIDTLDIDHSFQIDLYFKINSLGYTKDIIVNTSKITYNDKELSSKAEISLIDSDLSVTKTSSKTEVYTEDEFYYVLTIKNNGEGVARNIRVEDKLDSDLVYVSSEYGLVSDGVWSYQVNELKPGEEISFIIRVKVNSEKNNEVISNTVLVKEDGHDNKEDKEDVLVLVKEEEKKSEEVVENPNTGGFINGLLCLVGLVGSVGTIYITKKKQLFIK